MHVCPVRAHPPRGAGPNMVRVVLCSRVRQQPLTPLYHLTGPNRHSIDTYGEPHLSKCSVALTVNLLYSAVKECELRNHSMSRSICRVFFILYC